LAIDIYKRRPLKARRDLKLVETLFAWEQRRLLQTVDENLQNSGRKTER